MDLDELCAKHREAIQSAIRLTCARRGVCGEDADELGASLWICLLEHDGKVLRLYQGRSAIRTYLFSVMDRATTKWIRRRVVRQWRELPVGDWEDNLVACPDSNFDPEAAFAKAELLRHRTWVVRQASAKLPWAEKAVFRLRWAGHPIRVIAGKLGLSMASTEHHLYRAIKRLRDDVSKNEKETRGRADVRSTDDAWH